MITNCLCQTDDLLPQKSSSDIVSQSHTGMPSVPGSPETVACKSSCFLLLILFILFISYILLYYITILD